MGQAKVGIIANPVSARDIRRVVANAGSLQISDRANIVLRALSGLVAGGVDEVVMMPDKGSLVSHVLRGIRHARAVEGQDMAAAHRRQRFPQVHFLDMPVTGTVEDTRYAAQKMRGMGVEIVLVLGGDGTHRAVVAAAPDLVIAGISTGTNNAFPENREATIVGLAASLALGQRLPAHVAFADNKILQACDRNGMKEIALVDMAVVSDRYVGARALWRVETFKELFVTFCDSCAIGMSAIAACLAPVGRAEKGGLHVRMGQADFSSLTVHAPIAPGLVVALGIADYAPIVEGEIFTPSILVGALAFDGEREVFFDMQDKIEISLHERAFRTLDIAAIMNFASKNQLLAGQ